MRAESRRGSASRWRLLRLLPSVLVAALLVFLFSRLGAFHKLQTSVADIAMRVADPPARSEVALVEITDHDYKTLFGRQSPLDPARLRELIAAVAACRPDVIGVDIDTSPEKYRDFALDPGWPPVVWERDVEKLPESEEERLEPADAVLGRQDESLLANSGIPVFFDDPEDGMTRRYSRLLKLSGDETMPSFPWAIISRLPPGEAPKLTPSTEKYFIRYTGGADGVRRAREAEGTWLTASDILERSRQEGWAGSAQNPLRGKIVLIGGTYGDDDLHHTPVGRMYGAQIIAQVIETELGGGGDRAPPLATVLLLELFDSVAIILLFHAFHALSFWRALALNLLSVLVVSVVCGLVSYGSILRAIVFIPALVCLLIYEFSVEYRADVIKKVSALLGGAPEHSH